MLLSEIKRLRSAGPGDLRNFGLVVGGVLLLLALLFCLRHRAWWAWFGTLGLILILAGVIVPRGLKWLYVVWMTSGLVLGSIVSTILLSILFYILVAPIAAVARFTGKDFLSRKLDSNARSYWILRDESKTRSQRDCERQF
jgi:hypothetical protein